MATDTLLPLVNFDSNPGYNEFKFLHEIYSDEFFIRQLIGSTPGIVDVADPAASPFSTSRPLTASVNLSNTLTLDITSGYAITPNYRLIVVDGSLSAIPLPDVVPDKTYVVALEYQLVSSRETRTNRFGNPAEVRLERPTATPFGGEASTLADVVTVVSLNDFSNPSLFPDSRKHNMVVIALVVVRQDPITNSLSLQIDLTQTIYTFNRPWFSPVDVTHRSQIGSGLVTTKNPHGTELQDLSSAGFTLYQQLLPRGGIFAKDVVYYGYPGQFCQELVSVNRFEIDDTGEVTSAPSAGLPPLRGRFFVTLTKVPNRPGSLYIQGQPWKSIPYYWKPGTRFLVLGTLEEPLAYGTSLIVEYFATTALMPPAESLTQGVQNFELGEPVLQQDYIVTGGIALSSLAQTTIPLPTTVGVIKKAYQVLCNTDGTLLLNPQPLAASIKVADLISNKTVQVNQTPLNGLAVRLTLGLTRAGRSFAADPAFELNLQLRLFGFDENNSSITEDITFKASQWRDQDPTLLEEEPLQFRLTKATFTQLVSVQILNTTNNPDNSGADASLSVWANILESKGVQELANVASFFWNGTGAVRVTDERIIATTVQRLDQKQYRQPMLLPENDAAFIQEFFSVLLDPPLTDPDHQSRRLALELDDDRFYGETWKSFSEIDASADVILNGFQLVTPDMTLRIDRDKVLKFVSGTSDPTVGEVTIPTSSLTGDVELKNNIVNTVNGAIWDSTWFATAGNTNVTFSRPQAYIDGFVESQRTKWVFATDFNAGNVSFSVNGNNIGPVSSTGFHDTSLDAIVAAVNALTGITHVNVVRVPDSPISSLIFNGDVDGNPFTLTSPVFIGMVNSVALPPLGDPFNITQPTGGVLPTSHLPNRFLSEELPWHYQSRAIPWTGVKVLAEIAFNSTAYFKDGSATSASPILTGFANTTSIAAGQIVTGVGVTLGTTVLSTTGTTVTLSANATATGSDTYEFLVGLLNVQNLDQCEVVPGKIVVAKRGLPANPAAGDFTVTPTSLLTTLRSLADTINNRSFASGLHAEVAPTNDAVLIEIGGFAHAQINLLVETVNNSWVITPYTAVGSGSQGAFGFLKSIHPLVQAEWRYQLVDPDPLDGYPYSPEFWSPWQAMQPVSETAFQFAGPVHTVDPTRYSLYTVQLRLTGQNGQPNGFSFYQLSPQVSGATLSALNTRVGDLETEVHAARGTLGSVGLRLDAVVDVLGVPVKDTELSGARESTTRPTTADLKTRLDLHEGLTFWLTDRSTNYLNPVAMGNLGVTNRLVSGPTDNTNVTSTFLTSTGSVLTQHGTLAAPLVSVLNGNYYKFARNVTLDFNTLGLGIVTPTTVYVFQELPIGNELGTKVVSGTVTANASIHTSALSLSANVDLTAITGTYVNTPLVVKLPSITVGGVPFFSPITGNVSLNLNQIQLAGSLPILVPSGTPFEVWSYREPNITASVTPTASLRKLAIGQVTWNGTTLSNAINYRYLNRYDSGILGPFTVTSYLTPFSFSHNLGRVPTNWTILYHVLSTGDANPVVVTTELLVQATALTLTVINRYTGSIAKLFPNPPTTTTPTDASTGYLQLII